MDALVFDFDGVLVDSEPVHLRAFQQVLAPLGLTLGERDYYARYLGFDDRQCLATILADRGVSMDGRRLGELIAEKTALVQEQLASCPPAIPGAIELLASARSAALPAAICSSALRDEIHVTCQALGIAGLLDVIVAAEDVPQGKPDPACYQLAIQMLSRHAGKQLAPGRCVAIEDSPFGIAAARAAGMKVLAVTSSYCRDDLSQADRVVDCFLDITLDDLRDLV